MTVQPESPLPSISEHLVAVIESLCEKFGFPKENVASYAYPNDPHISVAIRSIGNHNFFAQQLQLLLNRHGIDAGVIFYSDVPDAGSAPNGKIYFSLKEASKLADLGEEERRTIQDALTPELVIKLLCQIGFKRDDIALHGLEHNPSISIAVSPVGDPEVFKAKMKKLAIFDIKVEVIFKDGISYEIPDDFAQPGPNLCATEFSSSRENNGHMHFSYDDAYRFATLTKPELRQLKLYMKNVVGREESAHIS